MAFKVVALGKKEPVVALHVPDPAAPSKVPAKVMVPPAHTLRSGPASTAANLSTEILPELPDPALKPQGFWAFTVTY